MSNWQDKILKRLEEMYGELSEDRKAKFIDNVRNNGIMQAMAEVNKTQTKYFGDMYPEVLENSSRFYQFDGKSTGLKYFDECLMGLRPSETIVVAGPSNLGKTMVALNLITSIVIKNNCKALIVSLEMPAMDIASRIYHMSDSQEHGRLMENIIIQTELDVNSKHIAAMIEKHRPEVVMIDHIQFLANQESGSNEFEKINVAVKNVQRLANEYKVPIILISHVAKTRSGANMKASAADLKGSSSIEQDTDIVFMLNRDKEQRQNGLLGVECVKQRKKGSKLYHRECELSFNGVRLASQGNYRLVDDNYVAEIPDWAKV